MGFLPGWDSVDSTASIAHNLHITAIVVLALLVLSEALALVYDSRKEHLTDIAVSAAEGRRKAEADAADMRRKAEVDSLERKLVVAEKAATKAAEQANELDRLRQPRHLTEEQQKTLRGRLIGRPKLQLVIKAGTATGDERAYAEEIASVLREIAWDIRVDSALFMGPNTSGLWLSVKGSGGEPVPQPVEIFRFALASVGLDIRDGIEANSGIPEASEVWLSIGRKK
ncbi:MAG: hypothetical protein QOI05_3851 [Bradyrhizobium sp.]|jgi:hypothetical protein|nr:hypothetical protein [Bradyrhizobium sp.]